MKRTFTRSNEPIFWSLFGAGGMWSALFLPVTILAFFIIPLFSPSLGADIYTRVFHTFIGKFFIFCTIVLLLWSGLHRIHHSLRDIKIHHPLIKTVCYGLAFLLSLLAGYLLIVQ